ncbi:MAG: DEAD/DEAH box helicase, partial [Coriobacteriales bacterium]|nr:DEAD/DEAH box helicase [Coriobacteriales bacterium]
MAKDSAIGRVEQTDALESPVSRLRSAGVRRIEGLRRLGISSIRDLLYNFPFRYNDFSRIVPIASAPLGERSSVLGTIVEVKIKRPRPRLLVIEASILDESSVLIATWFNQPWLQKTLVDGARVILQGKIEHSYGFRRMNSPLHTLLAEGSATGGIMAVYRANADVSQGWVVRMIDEAFTLAPALLDPLPASLRIRLGLMSRHAALRLIHQPPSIEQLRAARRRLAFEEIFLLQLYLLKRRLQKNAEHPSTVHRTDGEKLRALRALLPFNLTADQEQAAAEICADMARPMTMNRLLLGDVGSGKTIVAALALAAVCDSGSQAAMMAPTEVLAEQYAAKIGPLFDEVGIRWGLLTSSTKASERRRLLEEAASGSLSVIFGTHALIEPDLIFKALTLVIIDEQHRFGVDQREALCAKGPGADLLSMTATPIPRSLALTIYGDMDTSFIRTKPRQDARIETTVISRGERRFAYEAIREALKRGEQAYIVCPLIGSPQTPNDSEAGTQAKGEAQDFSAGNNGEPNASASPRTAPPPNFGDGGEEEQEERELITEFSGEQDEEHIQAAEQEVRFLRAKVFCEYNIGLMTSRLKSAEKRRVM